MGSFNDRRNKSANIIEGNPEYLENKFILKWWTENHDELLIRQISKYHWLYYWKIWEKIIDITTSKTIENWKKVDPICKSYAWQNILMYFSVSRAEELQYTNYIRNPEWKICPICENEFIENTLPCSLVRRLGINQIDFCAPCLSDILFSNGNVHSTKYQILDYIVNLTEAIQRIPPQNFGEGTYDIHDLSTKQRLKVLKILKNKPSEEQVKRKFNSWFNALIEAGVLDDDAQKLSRGTRCRANDGHICLSLGEKTIDDLLDSVGIQHEKEPKYPEGNYRADFKVNDIFIEYFGLKGQPEYDKKIKIKKRICKKHGIKLFSIYPRDLMNSKTLKNKILKTINE